MKTYDFDKIIDRRGTGAIKTDALKKVFGKEDLTAMWVADMDFEVLPEIKDALIKRAEHGIFGYAKVTDEYKNAVKSWMKTRHLNLTQRVVQKLICHRPTLW